jgi:organic radical activating enzyme
MDVKTISYTAANAVPVKIFRNADLVSRLLRGKIPLYHLQMIPTNKCNLNCSFCSCKKRNKKEELTLDQIATIIRKVRELGCKAVTITGGGEPLMHPQINEIIFRFHEAKIKVGLVTNGLLLGRLQPEIIRQLTWCRISCCDERDFDHQTEDIIQHAVIQGPGVDWAFSYVVGKKFNAPNLNRYVDFANRHRFTHVRVVSDLCDLDNVQTMGEIKTAVKYPDDLVIYQGRKEYDPGQPDCWISLLKPIIGADGKIYPCCGVQYAHEEQDLDMPESMCMGTINELDSLYREQIPFFGSQCARCYYRNYNEILGQMVSPMEHLEFV